MNRSRLAYRTCLLGLWVGLAACVTPPDEAQRIQGDVRRYGSWVLGCSNLIVCTALAPVREFENGDEPAHVRLTFTADKPQTHAAAIVREGEPVEEISAEAALVLVGDLGNPLADDVTFASRRGSRFTVPRNGFPALIQVLGRWRALPPQQLQSLNPVTPLPATPILGTAVPPLVAKAGKLCPKNHSASSPQAWSGAGGARLWRVHCANEGINSISFWFYSSAPGALIEPVRFEDRDGPAQAYNSQLDAGSGTLDMVHYFGGQHIYRHEDCGIYRSYGWTVKGLKLIEQRFMPVCGTKLDAADWIVTYQATLLNGSGRRP